MVFDGVNFYMYDFRNRLSEVYGVHAVSSQSSTSSESSSTESRSSNARLSAGQARRIKIDDLALGRQEISNRARGNLVDYARTEQRSSTSLRSSAITATGEAGIGEEEEPPTFEIVLEGVYGYDPFNRRVLRLDIDGDVRYAYDGWREVEELILNTSGVVSDRKDTVWGHGLGEILAYYKKTTGSWAGYFPFQDEQGSVMQLLDSSGGTVEQVQYDSYGKASYYWTGTSGAQAKSSVGNPWSFASGRLDSTTGLLYLRNRYLKTEFGRFNSLDAIGDWADPLACGNGYAYGGASPTNYTDELGLFAGGPQGQDPQPPVSSPTQGSSGGVGLLVPPSVRPSFSSPASPSAPVASPTPAAQPAPSSGSGGWRFLGALGAAGASIPGTFLLGLRHMQVLGETLNLYRMELERKEGGGGGRDGTPGSVPLLIEIRPDGGVPLPLPVDPGLLPVVPEPPTSPFESPLLDIEIGQTRRERCIQEADDQLEKDVEWCKTLPTPRQRRLCYEEAEEDHVNWIRDCNKKFGRASAGPSAGGVGMKESLIYKECK